MELLIRQISAYVQALAELRRAGLGDTASEVVRLTSTLADLRAQLARLSAQGSPGAQAPIPSNPGPAGISLEIPSRPEPTGMNQGAPLTVRADAPLPVRLTGPFPTQGMGKSMPTASPSLGGTGADFNGQMGFQAQPGKPLPNLTAPLGFTGEPGARGASGMRGEPGHGGGLAAFHLAGPLPLPVKGDTGGPGAPGAGSPSGGGSSTGIPGGQVSRAQDLLRFETQRAKQLTSPESRKALAGELRLQQQLSQAQAGSGYGKMAAEQSMFAAGATNTQVAINKIQQGFTAVTSAAQQVWSTGSSAILSLVRAASPVAFDTLTGSITLLAAKIGSSLIPYVDMLSLGIQKAATWYDSLSEGTKKWVGWALASATAIAGIVVVGGKLVGVLGMVITTARLASVALATMGSVAWANPITAAIGAVGLVLGGLATAWALTRDTANQAGDAMKAAADVKANGGSTIRPEDRGLSAKDVQAMPAHHRKAVLEARDEPAKLAEVLKAYRVDVETRLAAEKRKDLSLMHAAMAADAEANQVFFEHAQRYQKIRSFAMQSPTDAPLPKEMLPKDLAGIVAVRSIYASLQQYRDTGKGDLQAARYALKSALADVGKVLQKYKIPEDTQKKILADMRHTKDSESSFRIQQTPNSNFVEYFLRSRGDEELQAVRKMVAHAELVAKKVGTPGVTAPPTAEQQLKLSLKSLPSTRIQDSASYADSLQVAALNGGDLDSDIRKQQLENLRRHSELLTTLVGEVQGLRGESNRPQPFRGN